MSLSLLGSVSFGEFFVAVLIFAGLSMWVYWHASRHGSRHATAWGIAVFLIWPVILVYFLRYYMIRRRF